MLRRHRFAAVAARVATAVFIAATATLTAETVTLRWRTNRAHDVRAHVTVDGLQPGQLTPPAGDDGTQHWPNLLTVYAGQGSLQADLNVPPMLGDYSVRDGVLTFQPAYPLQAGVRYRAVLRLRDVPAENRIAEYLIPSPAIQPATSVTSIFPSSDVLPENLLKFYVHFSAPMRRGQIYDHIQLLGVDDRPVELPFLEIDEELWNPAMTRLTLFIDPGRIKREVKPLEDVGPALEAGKEFTLVIRSSWRDAAGQPLTRDFKKHFRVGPPDRIPPDPKAWRLAIPKAGSHAALTLRFPEAMDHALATRLITVTDARGHALPGIAALNEEEREWRFKPSTVWRAARYRVVAQTTIEDLAGNNIGKPFEVDLFEEVDRRLPAGHVELPFEVRQ